jgi:hypothetical protein
VCGICGGVGHVFAPLGCHAGTTATRNMHSHSHLRHSLAGINTLYSLNDRTIVSVSQRTYPTIPGGILALLAKQWIRFRDVNPVSIFILWAPTGSTTFTPEPNVSAQRFQCWLWRSAQRHRPRTQHHGSKVQSAPDHETRSTAELIHNRVPIMSPKGIISLWPLLNISHQPKYLSTPHRTLHHHVTTTLAHPRGPHHRAARSLYRP